MIKVIVSKGIGALGTRKEYRISSNANALRKTAVAFANHFLGEGCYLDTSMEMEGKLWVVNDRGGCVYAHIEK